MKILLKSFDGSFSATLGERPATIHISTAPIDDLSHETRYLSSTKSISEWTSFFGRSRSESISRFRRQITRQKKRDPPFLPESLLLADPVETAQTRTRHDWISISRPPPPPRRYEIRRMSLLQRNPDVTESRFFDESTSIIRTGSTSSIFSHRGNHHRRSASTSTSTSTLTSTWTSTRSNISPTQFEALSVLATQLPKLISLSDQFLLKTKTNPTISNIACRFIEIEETLRIVLGAWSQVIGGIIMAGLEKNTSLTSSTSTSSGRRQMRRYRASSTGGCSLSVQNANANGNSMWSSIPIEQVQANTERGLKGASFSLWKDSSERREESKKRTSMFESSSKTSNRNLSDSSTSGTNTSTRLGSGSRLSLSDIVSLSRTKMEG